MEVVKHVNNIPNSVVKYKTPTNLDKDISEYISKRKCDDLEHTVLCKPIKKKKVLETLNCFYHKFPPVLRKYNNETKIVEPYELLEYQKEVVSFILERERPEFVHQLYEHSESRGSILAMVMGLGKTLCSLTCVMHTIEMQREMGQPTLYLCPKSIIGTALSEIHKFYGNQLKVVVYHFDFHKKLSKLDMSTICDADLIISNYDTINFAIRKALRFTKKPDSADLIYQTNWFRIILDESHEIRNETSNRFKLLCLLKSKRKLCMTGTVICNGIKDIFTQLKFIGAKFPKGIKYKKDDIKRFDVLQIMKFVRYDDTKVKLSKKRIHIQTYNLSDLEQQAHKYFKTIARTLMEKKDDIQVNNFIVKCMQVCSGANIILKSTAVTSKKIEKETIFTEDKNLNRWVNDRTGSAGYESSKMKKFRQVITRIDKIDKKCKIIVFANSSRTLKLAIEAIVTKYDSTFSQKCVFSHGGIKAKEREKIYQAFKHSSKIRILFVTLGTGGVGLNLPEANYVIFLEPWWSYAKLYQGESRVHRIGQKKDVHIVYLIGKGTIEERIMKIANDKSVLAENVYKSSKKKPMESVFKNILCE